MKTRILIVLAGLSLCLTGCATVKTTAQRIDTSYAEVVTQHSPEEWAAFWRCMDSIMAEWSEHTLLPWTGDVLEDFAEISGERAKHWEAKQ